MKKLTVNEKNALLYIIEVYCMTHDEPDGFKESLIKAVQER